MARDPMWVVLMFDVPTKTVEERKEYVRFRNYLLDSGFTMTQYSVYVLYSPSGVLSQRAVSNIKSWVPSGGEIRIMHVTDTEWSHTIRFFNAHEENVEKAPEQLAFF